MEPIAGFSGTISNNEHAFNVQAYLASAGVARRVVEYRRSEKAYSQGDPATNIMYIQEGEMKLSVVNAAGKEAILAVLGPQDLFGEESLASQSVRRETAAALTPAIVLAVPRNEMLRVLHAERAFADCFIAYMLERISRIEGDLIDQLFNSSEKRLARTLLQLAQCGAEGHPQKVLHKVSQEMLAGMIGTTRSRVSYFMTKFRKLGFIEYDGGLHINPSLLNVVLHEEAPTFAPWQLSFDLRGSLRLLGQAASKGASLSDRPRLKR
jgi:CRP/FNR family cyclic AMP-dependent transcriptional regulator